MRPAEFVPWFAARADRLVVADNSGAQLRVIGLRHLGGPLELLAMDHPASQRLKPLNGTWVRPI